MSDQQTFETIRNHLHTCVIGDVLDTMGLIHQFLPASIRALDPSHVVVGRAMTVLEADCATDHVTRAGLAQSFGLMFEALDGLQPGEVYVCTGSSPRYALWGELMSTKAAGLGAAGAVVDGFHRDTRGIGRLGFPVFSAGSYGQDQRLRGRVIDYRCPIEFGNGVRVESGDLIVGDVDGVLVVPAARVDEAIALAVAKVNGEERVRTMIHDGASTVKIFAETGIM